MLGLVRRLGWLLIVLAIANDCCGSGTLRTEPNRFDAATGTHKSQHSIPQSTIPCRWPIACPKHCPQPIVGMMRGLNAAQPTQLMPDISSETSANKTNGARLQKPQDPLKTPWGKLRNPSRRFGLAQWQKMATDSNIKLAVLIDADNAQPSAANALLAEVAKYGTAFVRRAYGDWTGSTLRGWKEQLLIESIQPIQQFAYTTGKNATDSAMIIDAMDLLYTNRFDGFCLVSSDSDFTRLASRIRESGLVVYGFGERKTPKPFVSACDKFIYVENLTIVRDNPLALASTSANTTSTRDKRVKSPLPAQRDIDAELKLQLQLAVEAASDEDGWANLAKVGGLIIKRHPDFDPRTYGYYKFSEVVVASRLFDIDRRSPGEGKPIVVYAREKRSKMGVV